jgi:hypothetical protein
MASGWELGRCWLGLSTVEDSRGGDPGRSALGHEWWHSAVTSTYKVEHQPVDFAEVQPQSWQLGRGGIVAADIRGEGFAVVVAASTAA